MARTFLSVISNAVESPQASLSSWLGKTLKLTDGGFWSAFSGTESTSGQTVNDGTALKLSAVWACVRIISTSVAGLPLNVYERQSDGGRKEARELSLYDVVHASPNEDMTAFQFWLAVVASMMLHGNAYCEVFRAGGRVIALDFLLPNRIKLSCEQDGRLRYMYQPSHGEAREIPRENMLHIPAFTLDGRVGLSAIRFGAEVFGGAMASANAANATFKNGLMPTTAFTVDRVLKKDQREEFREYVSKIAGAMNAGKSPVLEQGVKPESIGINPHDAQLLESRAFGVEEVCRWFGVPPWMVGHTDKGSNWGSGLEQQLIAFLTFSISSITNQIQQCVNQRLLTAVDRRRYYTEFALEGFLKADSAARAAFYSIMTQNGIYTRDEARVKENLPRRGGNADVLTVQTSLAPIDQLGESSPDRNARNALRAWLDDQDGQSSGANSNE